MLIFAKYIPLPHWSLIALLTEVQLNLWYIFKTEKKKKKEKWAHILYFHTWTKDEEGV